MDRYCRAYGLDPRTTELPTVAELIRFQALEEYAAQNWGKDLILPGYAWRPVESQMENYLCEIADLLRLVAASLGGKISDLGLDQFGPIQNELPRVKSEEEQRQERIANEKKLFRG